MNYFEKISERSTGVGGDPVAHPAFALPVKEPSWPERTSDFEINSRENEDSADQPEFNSDSSNNTGDLHSSSPAFNSDREIFRTGMIKPGNEILPESSGRNFRVPNKNPDEETITTQSASKQESGFLTTKEPATLITKIFERFVHEDRHAVNPEPVDRGVSHDKQKTISAKILPPVQARQKPVDENSGPAREPDTKKRITPNTWKAAPVKQGIPSFVETGNHSEIPGKKESENKLVIGRITVEVIQNTSPPVPSNVPQRQHTGTRSPVNEMNAIDKLSFGLGQL